VLGLYKTRLRPTALLIGWAVGMVVGTALAYQMGLKPVYPLAIGGAVYPVYIGILAGALNLVVSLVASPILGMLGVGGGSDATRPEDFQLSGAD
jgi:solute:Na+ symporter, SSS family